MSPPAPQTRRSPHTASWFEKWLVELLLGGFLLYLARAIWHGNPQMHESWQQPVMAWVQLILWGALLLVASWFLLKRILLALWYLVRRWATMLFMAVWGYVHARVSFT